MGVITDGDQFEKIIIFGGIQNVVEQKKSEGNEVSIDAGTVSSFLSNKCFLVQIQQRSQGKSFFKDTDGMTSKADSKKYSSMMPHRK